MNGALSTWSAPPGSIAIRPAMVDVWLALCPLDADLEVAAAELSIDEIERARRFVFGRDRRRFIFARRTLRRLLAAYVGIAPAAVRFRYASHGKPALVSGPDLGIDFNVSHSGDAVVIAVSSAGPVGVDIEEIRPMPDRDDLAMRTFAPGEFRRLCAIGDSQRTEAFFACWTRKEAFVKALGEGLTHPLDRFEVAVDPTEPARLLHIDGDERRAGRWTISSLPPIEGFASALAFEAKAAVSCFRYPQNSVAATLAADGERCIA